MRPGQTAPEFFGRRFFLMHMHHAASMRPGQTAPEFCLIGKAYGPVGVASMRPGQTAPEFLLVVDELGLFPDELQ